MNSVMKLLVAAIAAAALVAVIYMMFVIPTDDPGMLIKKQLETAQVELGKIRQIQMMEYSKGYMLQGKTFDVRGRSVAFECNNENICCMKDEKCEEIEWDERLIAFKKKRPVETISRCFLEEGIFVCRVYFGQKPAQIEIEEVITEENLDISLGNEFPVSVKVKNSGNSIMPYGSVELKLYQWQTQFEKLKLVFLTQVSQPLTVMNPYEEVVKKFVFNPETSGKYEIRIKAGGENSGFWEKTIEFEVTGLPVSDCKMSEEPEETVCDPVTNNVKQKYFCSECKFGFECEKIWETELNLELEKGDKSFAYLITEEMCIDETPSEPSIYSPPSLPAVSYSGELQWPVAGLNTVNSCFGIRTYIGDGFHDGIDIPTPAGTPIRAMANGYVYKLCRTPCSGFGNSVILKHSDNLFTGYNHLNSFSVNVSDYVNMGDVIAQSGDTGAGGTHLDVKVYISKSDIHGHDTAKNPLCYFSETLRTTLIYTGRNCGPNYNPNPFYGCSS